MDKLTKLKITLYLSYFEMILSIILFSVSAFVSLARLGIISYETATAVAQMIPVLTSKTLVYTDGEAVIISILGMFIGLWIFVFAGENAIIVKKEISDLEIQKKYPPSLESIA